MARMGSAEIAAHLRREITGGTYRQHERLPASRQLAESFGVARNTLRDALTQLESEGLLESRRGSGTFVVYDRDDTRAPVIANASPLELMDARFALEPHICRLCVLHGRRDDFEAMERLCDRMEAAEDDAAAFAEADTAFHRALVDATRNDLLIWLIGQINTVRALDEWRRMTTLTLDAATIRDYNVQHRAIVNAIAERDPERAAACMKDHLEAARQSLTRVTEV